jgi:hypothetical protein
MDLFSGNAIFGFSLIAIIGVVILGMAIFKTGFAKKNWSGWAVLGAVLFIAGGGLAIFGGATSGITGLAVVQPNTQGSCIYPTGGNTASMNVVIQDESNPTLSYLGGALDFSDSNGSTIQTATTTTSGTSLAYTALSVTPCKTGKLTVLSNTTVNGKQVDADSLTPSNNYVIKDTMVSRPTFLVYNSLLSTIAEASGSTAWTLPQTLAQNAHLQFIMRVQANTTTNGQFGSDNGGFWITAASPSSGTVFDPNTFLTFNSQTGGFDVVKTPCPSTLQLRTQALACWYVGKPLKNSDGYVQLAGDLVPTLGAGAGKNVTITLSDENYARDTGVNNGKIVFGTTNSANADIGGTDPTLVISMT